MAAGVKAANLAGLMASMSAEDKLAASAGVMAAPSAIWTNAVCCAESTTFSAMSCAGLNKLKADKGSKRTWAGVKASNWAGLMAASCAASRLPIAAALRPAIAVGVNSAT